MAEGGRRIVSMIDPDKPYPMDLPSLGHAVIVNNVMSEMPGSMEDVQALKETYKMIGYKVQVHTNLTTQEMRRLKKWITDENNHVDSNSFLLTVICHGNKLGHLMDKNRTKAWDTELFIADLCEVETLPGKPKVLIIQACRGGQVSSGRVAPISTLAEEEELAVPHIVADKSDLFIAYATVPGYIAFGADEHGSTYLQAFATYLREEYLQRPLDRIYLMVKQHMAKTVQGKDDSRQCSEERNSLTRIMHFGLFHGVNMLDTKTNASPEIKDLKDQKEMEQEMRKMREKIEKMEIAEAEALSQLQEEKGKAERTVPLKLPANILAVKSTMPDKPQPVVIELTSSHDINLDIMQSFTVMDKTGKVAVKGQYNTFSSLHLYLFAIHGKHITRDKLYHPCQHTFRGGLLSVEIAGKEYLTISCSECNNIKLMDLQTGGVTIAYIEKKMMKMCKGEGNTLYVKSVQDQILELDCTHPVFSKIKVMNTEMGGNSYYIGLCYVPSPYRYIISTNGEKIVATACDTNTRVWKIKIGFPIKRFDPHGLLYSQRHHAILVADGNKNRIVVLNPSNGDTLQTLMLPGMGTIIDLGLNNHQLVVKHRSGIIGKNKISFFSIN